MNIVPWFNSSLSIMLLSVTILIAVALFAVIFRKSSFVNSVTYCSTALLTLLMLALALHYLLQNDSITLEIHTSLGLPLIGSGFRIDMLSAFFLIVVNLGSFCASIYGIGYGRSETFPERILPFFPSFIAGMNLVLLANDAFTFLVSWELMSLTSWALVLSHHHESSNRKAGYIYLIMAGFGVFLLMLAFGMMAGSEGNYAFDAIRSGDGLSPTLSSVVLLLALIGAGSKAGIVPLHVWLPLAHPAAPSHVSALMSGVMTKVAVYGFLRIVFDLLGTQQWWWGAVVLIVGGITSVLGVLYALMQHDIKRLLAYHTVENIGIIFIGIGMAMIFLFNNMMEGVALALTAALFHIFNHSVFKSLLFLGAGNVLIATGERDIEKLGGLIRYMPVTAFTFLVGSAAISALPPLNGFVSEWLTFQTILLGTDVPQWILRFIIPIIGAVLALSAALAAACFVKAFGMIFLGRSRSVLKQNVCEVNKFQLFPVIMFSLLCLLAGTLPIFVVDSISPVVHYLGNGSSLLPQSTAPWLSLSPVSSVHSSYNGWIIFSFITFAALTTVIILSKLFPMKTRLVPSWDCGYQPQTPLTQYSAGGFVQPIRRVFAAVIFRASEDVSMPKSGEVKEANIKLGIKDPVWDYIYRPIEKSVSAISMYFNRFKYLTVRQYLSYMFTTLIIFLVGITLWQ